MASEQGAERAQNRQDRYSIEPTYELIPPYLNLLHFVLTSGNSVQTCQPFL